MESDSATIAGGLTEVLEHLLCLEERAKEEAYHWCTSWHRAEEQRYKRMVDAVRVALEGGENNRGN